MEEAFDIAKAFAVQVDSALRTTKDLEIFEMARWAEAVAMTKDRDFEICSSVSVPHHKSLVVAEGGAGTRPLTRILPGPLAALAPLRGLERLGSVG